ncbi:MAG: hypothetical protein PHD51_04180 [Patescibacteria group bacterium]|nr:hypothetical protein [Patescibacteria group bacterium]MDD5490822.1 hypothetical protein [Patescibacteria group bacterium]
MPENGEIKLKKPIKELLEVFAKKPEDNQEIAKIKVSEMISKIAFFYEKIRNVIDYREEHLLRKGAVERIIRRKLLIEGRLTIEPQKEADIAKSLICELIRASYIPNESLPETKIGTVAKILVKYDALKKKIAATPHRETKKINNWLIGLMACEIEEELIPPTRDHALAETMYKLMNPLITVEGRPAPEENEKNTQIYLAIYRNLLKYDHGMLDYLLWNLYWPEWRQGSEEAITKAADNIESIRRAIEIQKNHPLREKLNKICKKYSVLFIIFKDIIEENPDNIEDILANPAMLEEKVTKVCNKKYQGIRTKLRRSVLRSIIYIFITKMALALAIEVPFDLFITHQLHYLSLGINILFHPLLLLFIALSVRIPTEKNTKIIITSLKLLFYQHGEEKLKYIVKMPAKRGGFLQGIFTFIYALTFVISFGILVTILNKLHFSILSMLLFILFLSVVSFFATRIRKTAKELLVIKKTESIFTAFSDFFFTPIIHAGRWLSVNFSKINVFIFIMDVIIEAPFKIFIDISEQWFAFVREKKEELEP